MSVLLDEMKIQEDLVWDKHTGELIGFDDLGDTTINYATLSNVQELATYVLVFLIKSIVNPISYSFATFGTTGATSFHIFPLFWEAVNYMERINLKIISITCDGTSPNRKVFRMHQPLEGDSDKDVVYRTMNIYSKNIDTRFIYFFADVPHLVKTTRFMGNSGMFILWSHISQFYYRDMECSLKMLTTLRGLIFALTYFRGRRISDFSRGFNFTDGQILDFSRRFNFAAR